MKLSELAVMSKWAVVTNADPYMAPEQVKQYLNGEVANHPNPKFKYGDVITTSSLKGKKIVEGEEVVATKTGTLYRIAEPKEDYEANFPFAKIRLMSSLPLLPEGDAS